MKSERRHELEKNELANWMAKSIEGIKPYTNWILGTILLATLATASYAWWSGRSGTKTEEAWALYYQALDNKDPEELDAVGDKYPNHEAAYWATIASADCLRDQGCDELFRDKAVAGEKLTEAVERYMKVLGDEDCEDPMLLQRATFGLARALESQTELERARQRYQEVYTKWPDGPFAAAAKHRYEELGKDSTRLDYDRFAKWGPPKSSYSDEPGTPGIRPDVSDPNILSSDPNLLSPGRFVPPLDPRDDGSLPVPRISPEGIPEPAILDPVLPDPTSPTTEPKD
ncbi:MAG TPA: hypothetical protein VMY42_06950 [Thermoguttaceae bacterium]|nr:hypothetical protein [Thermoguttaceae bacterium]